jgi:16S rRNA G966 N2-methylase RsmD
VGLEALSRGAASVLLVESDARAAAVIKSNIAAVALPGATVVTDRVERLLARPPGPGQVQDRATPKGKAAPKGQAAPAGKAAPTGQVRYDLAFADPPYAVSGEAITAMLEHLGGGWLHDDALVVVERATRSGPFELPPGYTGGKSRGYGEATFWYGWYGSGAAAAQAEAQAPPAAVPGSSPAAPPRAHDAPPLAHEE